MKPERNGSGEEYLVNHCGDTRGPFNLEMIEAMIMARLFPSNVPICKRGSKKWITAGSARGGSAPIKKSLAGKKKPVGTNLQNTLVVGGGVTAMIAVFVVFFEITRQRGDGATEQRRSSPSGWEDGQSKEYSPRKTDTDSRSTESNLSTVYNPPSLPKSKPPTKISRPAVTAEGTRIYRDSQGRTYRVPNSAYFRLLTMKSSLDTENADIEQAKAVLTEMSADIDRERIYLDRTSQYQVDAFNRKVNHLNSTSNNLQAKVRAYNLEVDRFNAELERVGTPIR